jgi:serine/threonine-protein kinase
VLVPGDVLGARYVLTAPIAAGGMGDVWQATDEVLGREVAVKVMRADGVEDDTFTARFRDEARNAAGLHHPHIASVFDYGEQDDQAWIVMELVPGHTVSELIRERGALPADEVRRIVGQSALALAAAHAAGVVHRDVKPSNIIVTPDGRAKLTDFGISRADDTAGHTLVGEVLGTPDYLSPEQALGDAATAASDLYALGVVAYELLPGANPFDRGAPVATARAHVTDDPPTLPDSVPADLRDFVAACLRKDPEQRPADAHAVGLELLGVPASDPSGMPSAALAATAALPAVAEPTAALDPSADEPTGAMDWAWDEPAPPDTAPTATRRLPSPVVADAESGVPVGRAARHTAAGHARAPGHTGVRPRRPDRRRIAWVAAAAALVIGGGAVVLGSALGGSEPSAARPATSTSPAPAPTTPAPTGPTTSPTSTITSMTTTKSSTEAAASQAPAKVAPVPPPSGQKAGKGKGHGKGKGNGR